MSKIDNIIISALEALFLVKLSIINNSTALITDGVKSIKNM